MGRAVDQALDGVRGLGGGAVQERAHRAGETEAVVALADLVACERGVVDADELRRLARPRRRHIDALRHPAAQVPQRRRGPVAQHAAGREDGGPQPAFERRERMAHRVHAVVLGVQPARQHALVDRVLAQPRGPQLLRRDPPALRRRELRNPPITASRKKFVAMTTYLHLAAQRPANRRPPDPAQRNRHTLEAIAPQTRFALSAPTPLPCPPSTDSRSRPTYWHRATYAERPGAGSVSVDSP